MTSLLLYKKNHVLEFACDDSMAMFLVINWSDNSR